MVRIHAVLLMQAESGSENGLRRQTPKAGSESGLHEAGSETEGSGSMGKGQVKVQGSISELINMLGGLEGLPA